MPTTMSSRFDRSSVTSHTDKELLLVRRSARGSACISPAASHRGLPSHLDLRTILRRRDMIGILEELQGLLHVLPEARNRLPDHGSSQVWGRPRISQRGDAQK